MRLPNLFPGVERRLVSSHRDRSFVPSGQSVKHGERAAAPPPPPPVCTGTCGPTQPCNQGCVCNSSNKCEAQ